VKKRGRDLVITAAACIEENLLHLIFLGIENVIAEIYKIHKQPYLTKTES
jgi:hypothetical protein